MLFGLKPRTDVGPPSWNRSENNVEPESPHRSPVRPANEKDYHLKQLEHECSTEDLETHQTIGDWSGDLTFQFRLVERGITTQSRKFMMKLCIFASSSRYAVIACVDNVAMRDGRLDCLPG
jgi:hypothetical protein